MPHKPLNSLSSKISFCYVRRVVGNEAPLSEEALAAALRDEGWDVRAFEEDRVETVENHDGSMDDYHHGTAIFRDRDGAIRFQKALRDGDSYIA